MMAFVHLFTVYIIEQLLSDRIVTGLATQVLRC